MSKVDHPAHYVEGNYECIEVMKSVFGKDEVKTFCKLNAFKYLWRCNHICGNMDDMVVAWAEMPPKFTKM